MVGSTLGRNVIALFILGTITLAGLELQAVSAVIGLLAAFESGDALIGISAPSLVAFTFAESSRTFVVQRIGTAARNRIARLGSLAPSGTRLVRNTLASKIKGTTARIKLNTFALNGVPGEAGGA